MTEPNWPDPSQPRTLTEINMQGIIDALEFSDNVTDKEQLITLGALSALEYISTVMPNLYKELRDRFVLPQAITLNHSGDQHEHDNQRLQPSHQSFSSYLTHNS